MKFIIVFTYSNREEAINIELIESVVMEKPKVAGVIYTPEDYGAVVLKGNRRIAFGRAGEAANLVELLNNEHKQ